MKFAIQSFTSNFNPLDDFPIETTEVIYIAIDLTGYNQNYSFTLTVINEERHQIANCPPIYLVITPIVNCEVIATWKAPITLTIVE